MAGNPSYVRAWQVFTSPERQLLFAAGVDGGLYVQPQPAVKSNDLETFAACYDIALAKQTGALVLVCRVAGCRHEVPCTHAGSFKFSNAKTHLRLQHRLVTYSDAIAEVEKTASGGAAAGAKRSRGSGGAVEGAAASARAVNEETGCALHADDLAGAWAKAVTLGMLAPRLVENPGIQWLFRAMKVSLPSARAVYRAVHEQKKHVLAAITAQAQKMMASSEIAFNGHVLVVQPRVGMVCDNWTSRRASTFMGFSIAGYERQKELGFTGRTETLRPWALTTGFRHFTSENDESHDACMYRRFYVEILDSVAIHPDNVIAATMDTAFINYKSLSLPPEMFEITGADGKKHLCDVTFDNKAYIPCCEHEGNLIAKHTARMEPLKSLLEASNDLSVFLRATEKRSEPLLTLQRAGGVPHPALPLTACPTRFFYSLLQVRQLQKLDNWLDQLRTRWETGKVDWLGDFLARHDRWRGMRTVATQVLSLFEPLLKDYNRLGSEREYTLPVRLAVFERWNAAAQRALADPACIITDVAKEFQRQLWLRLATVAQITTNNGLPAAKKVGPDIVLTEREKAERLQFDDISNAAAYVDPAMWPTFKKMGGHRKDAQATLWNLFKAMIADSVYDAAANAGGGGAAGEAVAVAGGGVAVAAGGAAADIPPWELAPSMREARLLISKREKPPLQAQEEFDLGTAELIDAEKARRQRLGLPEDDHADRGGAGDLMLQVQDQFLVQCKAHEEEMDRIHGADAKTGKLTFGDPLAATGALTRYSYWPSREQQLYLLAVPASIVVTLPWTNMRLERANSASGIIAARLRAAMTPQMLESFLLGQQLLKQLVPDLSAPTDILDLQQWAEKMAVGTDEDNGEDAVE